MNKISQCLVDNEINNEIMSENEWYIFPSNLTTCAPSICFIWLIMYILGQFAYEFTSICLQFVIRAQDVFKMLDYVCQLMQVYMKFSVQSA